MGYDMLLKYIEDYDIMYRELIYNAYQKAYEEHGKGKRRKSGEEYIIHPVAVACIVAEMKMDADTIAAALLHDVLEDCGVSKEELEKEFNPTIAKLVDGVTKLTSNDKKLANEETLKKFIISIMDDIRVIFIKLADRLHNMRTLQYQTPEKQIEKSIETMDVYVPIANLIGIYKFKQELEDLSFKYINTEEYEKTKDLINKMNIMYLPKVENLYAQIDLFLRKHNINFKMYPIQNKNIYGVYKRLEQYNGDIEQAHDLFKIKIILDTPEDCRRVNDLIINEFNNIEVQPHFYKDYITHPKANGYRSIHSTFKLPCGRLVQLQFKTQEMYMINSYGFSAYYSLYGLNNSVEHMQSDYRNKWFYSLMMNLINIHKDMPTAEFNKELKKDMLSGFIAVYDEYENPTYLKKGSTVADYIYERNFDTIPVIKAIIDDKYVSFDTQIFNGNEIRIIRDEELVGPPIDINQYRRYKK